MIPFTPDAVAKCFGTVVADVNKMNSSSVNSWFKSTFPEVARVANQNPGLFNLALANPNITAIPATPKYFQGRGDDPRVRSYNVTISKINVAFAMDLRSAMSCAGYSAEQTQKAIAAFNKLFPRVGK